MELQASSVLSAWDNFYVILGSAAAGLTGLQFVVVTLIAETHMRRSQRDIDAWGTPTVVHFSMVLLVSALLSAPWQDLADPAEWIALAGIAGLVYSLITRRRIRVQSRAEGAYQPALEDVIWYRIVPSIAYVALLLSGIWLYGHHARALYAIAGVVLALLLIAIRNAWDTITFIVELRAKEDEKSTPRR